MNGVEPAVIERLRRREPRALGRALSWLESRDPRRAEVLAQIGEPEGDGARRIGITGPPGAGKSTLVAQLVDSLRAEDLRVAVLAVDPTSPFSGGALLGDRVRMHRHYTDPEVFIRSMATRGALGGLAAATQEAVELLDAVGYHWVVVETVGVGQDEVDVIRAVDTVAVVAVPGLGDEIQAIKAGVMEIADLFVLNKADLDGAGRTRRHLENMLDMDPPDRRRAEIIDTIASRGEGIEQMRAALARHWEWLVSSGTLQTRRRQQRRQWIEALVLEQVVSTIHENEQVVRLLEQLVENGMDPFAAARQVLEVLGGDWSAGVAAERREEER